MMLSLLRQRNFALLWWGGLISMLGDWMLMIGLPIYVYQLSESTLATGLLLITYVVPRICLGSVAGVLVDRWDRRRTMVVSNLLLALGLLPLLFVQSEAQLWLIYIVTFVQASIRQFFGPAEGALLPQLVAQDHLLQANALNAMNNNLARLLGPPLGGVVAGLFGLSAITLLDATSFVVSAALIALIRFLPEANETANGEDNELPPPAPAWVTIWHEWLFGLRLILDKPILVRVFLWSAITAVGEGVMSVLMVPFVDSVLQGGAVELGWLMGAQAVGGILGGLLMHTFKRTFPLPVVLGASSIAFGMVDLAIFNYPAFLPDLWPALVLFVVVGFPGIWMTSAAQTLIQSATLDKQRGRVLGAHATTAALLSLAGMVCASFLGDTLGIVAVLNVQGGGYVVAGLLILWLMYRVVEPRKVVDQSVSIDATAKGAHSAKGLSH